MTEIQPKKKKSEITEKNNLKYGLILKIINKHPSKCIFLCFGITYKILIISPLSPFMYISACSIIYILH